MAKLALGRLGEELAARFCGARGWTVLRRNLRLGAGEVDLLVGRMGHDGPEQCVVEVRTRRMPSRASPEDSVRAGKRARLGRLAEEVAGLAGPEVAVRVVLVAVEVHDETAALRWLDVV